MSEKRLPPSTDKLDLVYPTPILKRYYANLDDLNQQLIDYLHQLEQYAGENSDGHKKSNVAGWRSGDDLLNTDNTAIKQLEKMMIDSIQVMLSKAPLPRLDKVELDMFAWANINRDGSYNTPHIHPTYHFAGIYYVATGTLDRHYSQNGQLEIIDPRPAAAAMPITGFEFGGTMQIKPRAGLLVIFPAWLMHSVLPFKGAGERISIPFNIKCNHR